MCWVARLLLPAILAFVWPVAADNRIRIGAPSGHVPLRIAPNTAAEVALYVPSGAEIQLLNDVSNAWLCVVPPPQTIFWLYAELVRDGIVSVNKAQVRAGAGLSHKAVASLNQGTSVNVRGRLGDWLRIAAPSGIVLWVAGEYASTSSLSPAAPDPSDGDATTRINEATVLITTNIPCQLQQQRLATGRTQGEVVQLRGRLDWSSQWHREQPVSFNLLNDNQRGDCQPVCQLVASASAYEKMVGSDVCIIGSRWWLVDEILPLILVERLEAVTQTPPL